MSDAYYLESLTIQNIRCFQGEEQTLRLTDDTGKPAMWTLILGDNGVGKRLCWSVLFSPWS